MRPLPSRHDPYTNIPDTTSSTRGFTLAELLIVVAIIAVLVAIAIPVFNSQLEKSREATDLANVRSAYAEVMTAAITEDKTAAYNGTAMYDAATGTYKAVVSPLAQKQDGWATSTPITIGGVTSGSDGGDNADKTWIGKPKASGSCTITYDPATAKVTIDWNGSGGGSDSGSGGDTGSGGSAFDKLTKDYTELTDQEVACVKGNVYKFEGKYYVCVADRTTFINNQYTQQTPTKNYTQQFRELSSSAKVNSDADLEDVYHDGKMLLRNPANGQLYSSKDGKYYIYTNSGTFSYPAPPGDHWVEINYSAK